VSQALTRFWQQLEAQRAGLESSVHFELILEQVLRSEEGRITSRLDFSRALVRLGPMLGLAGTIIPLGPALQSLMGGDMAGMVGHLVVGFGAVVCGLVMSGIAYVITLVRERWSRVELEEMEHLCELLVTARNAKPAQEALHAGIRA
jgi:biopolymer transport protein ExbB/TolQ